MTVTRFVAGAVSDIVERKEYHSLDGITEGDLKQAGLTSVKTLDNGET